MTVSPDEVWERLRLAGDEWADLNYAAQLLEETKKSVLAQITSRFMAGGASKAAAEVEALAHDDYLEHLRSMVAARRDANKARVTYDTGKVWAEQSRTKAATDRAQMNLR